MSIAYRVALDICKRHADRLAWAKSQLRNKFPLSADAISNLNETELAVLDQFTTRFAKLQDAMGEKLFPAVLELTKEHGNYSAFLDKLNRLEKIGAIESAEKWLILREMRNEFSHDYPDDPGLQSAMLNKAWLLASELIAIAHSPHKKTIGKAVMKWALHRLSRKLPDLPELDADEVLKGTEMLETNLDRIRANAIAEGVLIGELKGELKGKLEGKLEGESTLLERLIVKRFGSATDDICCWNDKKPLMLRKPLTKRVENMEICVSCSLQPEF